MSQGFSIKNLTQQGLVDQPVGGISSKFFYMALSCVSEQRSSYSGNFTYSFLNVDLCGFTKTHSANMYSKSFSINFSSTEFSYIHSGPFFDSLHSVNIPTNNTMEAACGPYLPPLGNRLTASNPHYLNTYFQNRRLPIYDLAFKGQTKVHFLESREVHETSSWF